MDVLTQLGLIQTATGSDCPLLQSCGGSKTDRLRCHDLARDIWWWKWGKGWTVCNNLGCLEIQTFPSGAYAFGETTGLCVMRQALLWPCGILICKKGCSHTWPICITTAAFSISGLSDFFDDWGDETSFGYVSDCSEAETMGNIFFPGTVCLLYSLAQPT